MRLQGSKPHRTKRRRGRRWNRRRNPERPKSQENPKAIRARREISRTNAKPAIKITKETRKEDREVEQRNGEGRQSYKG